MARYIDADLLLEKMKKTNRYFDVKFDVEEMPTADVVPKSEVDRLSKDYEGSQKTIKGLTEMIRGKNKELAKLETHLELHYGERSLNNLITKEKSEVAREIFEEIEKIDEDVASFQEFYSRIMRLKKKYTEIEG